VLILIKVRRPVAIIMILTEQSKTKMKQEYQESARRLKLEMEQLQFQGKKLMTEAQKKGNESVKLVQERIGQEYRGRREKLDIIMQQLEQLEHLEIGSELHHSTMESECTIQVGDNWEEWILGAEIVIKDAIIIEIRRPKGGSH
jgi:hypothetical protein